MLDARLHIRVTDRLRTWRRDAAFFRGYGDTRTADLLERLAEELEADLDEGAGELVDLSRIARAVVSGD